MRRRQKKLTLREYIAVAHLLTDESLKRMQDAPYSGRIGRHETRKDLTEATIGEIVDGSTLMSSADTLLKGVAMLTGLTEKQLMDAPAQDVIGFVGMCRKQFEGITARFEACRIEPTADERKAGIDKLPGGVFGLIDWYARRMGITDHDWVFDNVKWVYIYRALQIDTEQQKFERRLQDILYKKSQTKRKHK